MTLKAFFSNKKNRILLFIFFLFILYIILFSSARKAEVLSTFPALKLENNNTSSIKTLPENFQEINVKDKNGDNINGIYLPAKEQTKKTVYFFHGNSGDLSYFYNWITYINNLGYNVISYDYP
ncbi:MAG: hypothetical protein P1U46_00815 [Patescibacteria group bacterium]|nr:hypothetical protein [Patescibacteria group bacterium]